MSASNPHSWSPKYSMSIDDWLAAFPPSTTSSPEGGDGWLWVHGSQGKKAFGSVANDEKDPVVAKAQAIWDEAKDSAASIAQDENYPTRAKQGQTSKKQARDKISLEARSKLIDLLKAGSWKTGKWLFFPKVESVDYLWAKLARSVASGPLSRLDHPIQTIKVATSNGSEDTRVICVYFDECWEPERAKEVLISLAKDHGEIPSAVKADLWTVIGIDSKNGFGMRSTLFTPKDLVLKETLDELKKDWQEENKVGEGGKARVKATTKTPVLNDDDFEVDSEEEEKGGGKASGSGSNGKAAVSGVKKKREDDSGTDEGDSRAIKKAK